jgi:hypothetical protein
MCVCVFSEHYLRQIDASFWHHLHQGDIEAQLYGMRWARLLFGREFPLTDTHSLRLWDYMFSYCGEWGYSQPDAASSASSSTASTSPAAMKAVPLLATGKRLNAEETMIRNQVSVDVGLGDEVPRPLLRAVADLMLAMLLYVSTVQLYSICFNFLESSVINLLQSPFDPYYITTKIIPFNLAIC